MQRTTSPLPSVDAILLSHDCGREFLQFVRFLFEKELHLNEAWWITHQTVWVLLFACQPFSSNYACDNIQPSFELCKDYTPSKLLNFHLNDSKNYFSIICIFTLLDKPLDYFEIRFLTSSEDLSINWLTQLHNHNAKSIIS